MNISHLGDALDHWKGCLVQATARKLIDLHVVPMFTDENVAETWSHANLSLYSRLLALPTVDKVVQQSRRYTWAQREEYFRAVPDLMGKDVFLDPDNGVMPPSGGDFRHLAPKEVGTLVSNCPGRIVMIYQHSWREDNWTRACVDTLLARIKGSYGFAYWAGSASMIFVSTDVGRARLCEIQSLLSDSFGVPGQQNGRVSAVSP